MTIKPPGEPVTPGHSQDKKELDHYLEGLFFIVLYFSVDFGLLRDPRKTRSSKSTCGIICRHPAKV